MQVKEDNQQYRIIKNDFRSEAYQQQRYEDARG